MFKVLCFLIVGFFAYVNFTGRTFFDFSSERKMTPKGKRYYYYHK